MNKLVDLARLDKGQSGTVNSINGGAGLMRKLENLGLRPGNKVSKVSNLFGKGPVVVLVGGTEVALGFGMAKKIMIELEQ